MRRSIHSSDCRSISPAIRCFTHMVAQQCGLEVGEFIWSGGDVHIYSNHMEQVKTQLEREPLPLPKLVIKRKPDSIFDYRFDDFEFVDYHIIRRLRRRLLSKCPAPMSGMAKMDRSFRKTAV